MCEFQFFFGLNLGQRLFSISDNLSKTLQKESMSALEGLHIAELTIDTYQGMRTVSNAKLFFDIVSKKALDYTFVNKPELPRKRKRPNYRSIVDYMQIDGYDGKEDNAHHPSTPEEYFRGHYFDMLDLIITSIKDRFNQPAFVAFLNLEQLLLNIINESNYDSELEYVKNIYKDDIDTAQIKTEAFSMSTMFKETSCANFFDIFAHLQSLHPTKLKLIPNIITIVQLILINPATSCTPERSFFNARRLKTWLRSTMTTKRFNNLAILYTHKALTDTIDFVEIGNEFAAKYDVRKYNLGKFIQSDL